MKKLASTLFFTIFSFILAISQNLSDGLLLHYNFNGNANDISGNGMNATVYGASLTGDRNGNPNSAYYFDGVDDFIQLPNESLLKPQLPVSFSAITYLDPSDNDYPIIRTDISEDIFYGCWLNLTDHLNIEVGYGSGNVGSTSYSDKVSFVTEISLKPNNWYHIVAVIESKNDIRVWVDGINQTGEYVGLALNDEIYYNSSPTSGAIGVMDYYFMDPYYFKGIISDVRLWNRVLTDIEIDLLFDSMLNVQSNESNFQNLINIYPNPSNGNVTLLLNSEKPLNIELYDITGKVILQFTNYRASELKINNLNQGLYFVKVQDEAIQTTQKIIVTKD
jgi:hypothetical protein